ATRPRASSRRPSSDGRGPDHELRRQEHPPRAGARLRQELERDVGGLLPLPLHALPDGRERRVEMRGELQIVEPRERDVVRDRQTARPDGPEKIARAAVWNTL